MLRDRARLIGRRGWALTPVLMFLAALGCTNDSVVRGTQGYRDEINRPPERYSGPSRTGAQVYAYRCAACHDKTTQGAPLPQDDIEWQRRAEQGMAVLMRHVVEGYNKLLMPPRGGCGNCSDAELKAAVIYMLEQSHVEAPP